MNTKQKTRKHLRMLAGTAILSALSFVLMLLEFPVPFVPEFLKMDMSDLPALIAAYAYGPLSGVLVALIKNLLHLPIGIPVTGGAGELANFLLCCCFVLPAGFSYRLIKGKKGALYGGLIGAFLMAVVSLPVNYYITYPVYMTMMPMEVIMGMYQAINPAVESLWSALLMFNLPLNLVKGLLNVAITFIIYKKLSPILHGGKS